MDRRWQGWGVLAAAVVMIAATVYFTFPLAFNASDHLVNFRDPMLNTYLMGHGAKALVTNPLGYFDCNVCYPFETTNAFGEHYFAQTLFMLPVILLLDNPVLGHNLAQLLAYFLSGMGAFVLARELTGSARAAILSAVIFAFASMRMVYVANVQIQWIWPLPFALLWLHRYMSTGRRRWLALFTAAMVVQVCSSVYYAVFAFLFVTLAALLLAARGREDWPTSFKRFGLVLASLVVTFVITLPLHVPYVLINLRHGAQFSTRVAQELAAKPEQYLAVHPHNNSILKVLCYDVLGLHAGFLFPGVLAVVLAAAASWRLRKVSGEQKGWLGIARTAVLVCSVFYVTLLAAAAVANLFAEGLKPAIRTVAGWTQPFIVLPALLLGWMLLSGKSRAAGRHGGELKPTGNVVGIHCFMALAFFIVSLGPRVSIGTLDMGYGLHSLLYTFFPPLKGVRYVNRFAILVLLCVAVLAAVGAEALLRRLRAGAATALVAASLAFLTYEYSVRPLELQQLPREEPAVYRWLGHQEGDFAIIELPFYDFSPHESIRAYWSLRHGKKLVNGYEGYSPPQTWLLISILNVARSMPSAEALAYLRSTGFRYMIVHEAAPGGRNAHWVDVIGSAGDGVSFTGYFGEAAVFESLNYMRGRTRLRYVRKAELAGSTLRFGARGLAADAELDESLEVLLDGRALARFALSDREQTFEIEVPELEGLADVRELEFRYSYSIPAAPRYAAGSLSDAFPADVELAAATRENGWVSQLFSRICVNGRSYSRLGRGYTLAVLDPDSGEVVQQRTFNTEGDEAAAAELAGFVGSVERGQFVLGITSFNAWRKLDAAAVRALRSLGSVGAGRLLRHQARNHAFIGRKGARPGTALESTGWEDLLLQIGRNRRETGFELRGLQCVKKDR